MTLPRLGDVYETKLPGNLILLCVHVRDIRFMGGSSYDFFVLDGVEPTIRTWSSRGAYDFFAVADHYRDFSMEATMRNFKFKKIG